MTVTPPDPGPAQSGRDRLLALVQSALAGRYRVERALGHGAMAVVFRAHNLGLDRAVAIKVMRPETGYEDGVVERFRTEALAMAQLHHPHIVAVHARGEAGSILWFEMDLVDGDSLDKLLRSGPLESVRTARLLAQAADALAYAHSYGVIHRDIKPANLLVSGEMDQLLITDFGIAKIVGASTLTATGMTVGTLAYMSPEQLGLDGKLTVATDQYSLGAVGYQMLTGVAPPMADPYSQRTGARDTQWLTPVRTLAPACPPDLARLVERMLARLPEARWPDLAFVQRAAQEIALTGKAESLGAERRPGPLTTALKRFFGRR